MTTTTDTARAVLLDLETKLAAAGLRAEELDASARGVAYAAHVDGGDAKKRLEKIDVDKVKCSAETSSLNAAIGEAKRRLREALAYEAGEAGRAAAVRRFAILESMAARCARLDAMFAKENAELQALFDEYEKAGREGELPCSRDMFRVSTNNARLAGLS